MLVYETVNCECGIKFLKETILHYLLGSAEDFERPTIDNGLLRQ